MIGSFWNLCRACPSMPVDKLANALVLSSTAEDGEIEVRISNPITYKWEILIGLVVCYSFTPSTGALTNGTNILGRDRKWCEGRLKPCLLQPVEAAYRQLGV
uniref:(California timema) hypothetical protein n=1 Tax=Timema californicum TaxID=61474 RepID=A0A7R9PE82_TIMCA|nr:unnamed protein product [Timema californicum]